MDGEVVGWCNANDLTRYTHLDDHGATIVRKELAVSDVVAILGSINIIAAELDR